MRGGVLHQQIIKIRHDAVIHAERECAAEFFGVFHICHKAFIDKEGELALDGFEKRVWAGPHPERAGAIKAQAVPGEIIVSLSDATGKTTVALD